MREGQPGIKMNERSHKAAADVGDGGQPTPPPESETQREAQPERPEQVTRSGRKAQPAPMLIEAMATEIAHTTRKDVEGEIFCYATVFADDDKYDHDDPFLIYKAVSDPDTMYFHQAMKENDSEEFRASIIRKWYIVR